MRKGVSVKKKMVRQRIIVPYYGIQNNPADNTIRTEGVFEELSQMKHEKQEVSGCWDCMMDSCEFIVINYLFYACVWKFQTDAHKATTFQPSDIP